MSLRSRRKREAKQQHSVKHASTAQHNSTVHSTACHASLAPPQVNTGDATLYTAVDGLASAALSRTACTVDTIAFRCKRCARLPYGWLPAGHNHCGQCCHKKDGIPPSVAANIIDAADLLLWSLVAGDIRTVRTVVYLHCSICRLDYDCVWGCFAVGYCASNLHSTSICWFAAGDCAAVLLLWLLLAHLCT